MIINDKNKTKTLCTLGETLKGTTWDVHSHFHAG
jgi:hypothetical protein